MEDVILARVNVTWDGGNGDLPEMVPYDATDAQIKAWATESITNGVPGLPADPNVDLTDFKVYRFDATDDLPNRLFVSPKTPFGN